jgi:hypothetical protein
VGEVWYSEGCQTAETKYIWLTKDRGEAFGRGKVEYLPTPPLKHCVMVQGRKRKKRRQEGPYKGAEGKCLREDNPTRQSKVQIMTHVHFISAVELTIDCWTLLIKYSNGRMRSFLKRVDGTRQGVS